MENSQIGDVPSIAGDGTNAVKAITAATQVRN